MTFSPHNLDCIATLRDLLVRKEMSARENTAKVLDVIKSGNIATNAFSAVFTGTAECEAIHVDRLLKQRKPLGSLAGVPIAIKDNIDAVPGPCPSGLELFADHYPECDAELVTALRGEQAIVVGAARTDAGAFGVTTPSVINPRFPDRIVGGSSGGPAAAVAAGYCSVAIGTDTGGSLRIPAACCGVYGLKPSVGRVSLDRIRPLSDSFDHAGPIARCIDDLIVVMHVIDPAFKTTCGPTVEKPVVLGIPRNCFRDASEDVHLRFDHFIEAAAKQGCRVRELVLPTPAEILPIHLTLSLYEAAQHYRDITAEEIEDLPAPARDGIIFGRKVTAAQRALALEKRTAFVRQFSAALETVDALAMPTLPILPPERDVTKVDLGSERVDLLMALIRYTATFDQTGHPALAVPWSVDADGLPGSVQLVGQRDQDFRLLHIAKELRL